MAREDRLAWATLAGVTAVARAFLNPVLACVLSATWDKEKRLWK
jgi:hypothetical protein